MALCAFSLLLSHHAQAGDYYWGIGHRSFNFETSGLLATTINEDFLLGSHILSDLYVDLGALEIKAGSYFLTYLAIEVRAGFGVVDDSVGFSGSPIMLDTGVVRRRGETVDIRGEITAELDNYTSVFIKLSTRGEKARFYALMGLTDIDLMTKVDATKTSLINGVSLSFIEQPSTFSKSVSISDKDLSYGVGFEYGKKHGISLEYLVLADASHIIIGMDKRIIGSVNFAYFRYF